MISKKGSYQRSKKMHDVMETSRCDGFQKQRHFTTIPVKQNLGTNKAVPKLFIVQTMYLWTGAGKT